MSCSQDNAIPSLLFEHACKNSCNKTIGYILNNEDLSSQVISSCASSENKEVKPVFIFIYMLKKLNSLNILSNIDSLPEELSDILSIVIDLLETTYRQYNFISLKKFFYFLHQLKHLDLLCLIAKNVESPKILQKLNQYFPSSYKETVEKNYNIENSKLLDKAEESNAHFRRLILKLAVDLSYRAKYMTEQYIIDVDRIAKESICYIKETINALELCAGTSLLETLVKDEENAADRKDLSVQLLFEYIQPEITDDGLIKFLEDLDPSLDSQPISSALTSCLAPFDSLSEDEDSDSGESEYELSQNGSQPVNGR